ncbi:MAG: hypothetical protein ACIAQZ_03380 [Sedimentisphaeraceae bacterium JB056]
MELENKEFESLNIKIGTLISSYKPTVDVNSDGFDIRSNLRKFSHLLLLFPFFVPIILAFVAYILFPETFELENKLRIIIPFIVSIGLIIFLFRGLIVRYSLRYRIENGFLEICSSYFFKPIKTRLQLQNLTFKIYQQKGNHKRFMLRHGTYVFSFYDSQNEQRGEYIIAVYTKRKDIIRLYETFKPFYPVKIDKELLEPEKKSNISTSDIWELMSYKTIRTPFFLIASAFPATGVCVAKRRNRCIIKPAKSYWVEPVISFATGVFLGTIILYSLIAGSEDFDPSKVSDIVLSIVISMLAIFCCFYGILKAYKRNKIVFDSIEKTITITYFEGLSKKTLTLSREQTIYKKYVIDLKHSKEALKPGNTVLAISKPHSDFDIILIASDREDTIQEVDNVILSFCNNQYCQIRENFEYIELHDGRKIKFSKSRLKDDDVLSNLRFKIVNENIATLMRPESYLFYSIIPIPVGVALIISFWISAEKENIGMNIFITVIGLLMFTTGCAATWQFFKNRTLNFDKTNNSVYCAPFADAKKIIKQECLVSEIAALQVCASTSNSKNGKRCLSQTLFQMNAIMNRGKDDDRETIITASNSVKIYKIAQNLSSFLEIPLIDSVK